jgi:hypothetical protein
LPISQEKPLAADAGHERGVDARHNGTLMNTEQVGVVAAIQRAARPAATAEPTGIVSDARTTDPARRRLVMLQDWYSVSAIKDDVLRGVNRILSLDP